MLRTARPLALLMLLTTTVSLCATAQAADVPGDMQLLPGYKHKALQGIDSRPGVIEKEGGLKIHYDIGAVIPAGQPRFGGSYSNRAKAVPENQREWYKEQTIDGQVMSLAYTKNGQLLVSIEAGGINLSVKAKDSEEVAEALLMILSYRAKKKN